MAEPNIRVEEVTEPFDGLVPAVGALVAQLSRSSPAPSASEVEEIVRSPASHLLLARDGDGTIVGMLTLAMFRIPTGLRAWIEDARGGQPPVPASRLRCARDERVPV